MHVNTIVKDQLSPSFSLVFCSVVTNFEQGKLFWHFLSKYKMKSNCILNMCTLDIIVFKYITHCRCLLSLCFYSEVKEGI